MRGEAELTVVQGLSAAQCWTCGHFYELLFGEAVSLETGMRVPKLRPPLGNPDTEERAWVLASGRLGIVFEEAVIYEEAAASGAVLRPSRHAVDDLLEQGKGMVNAPLHLMVPNRASRLGAANMVCHLNAAVPPPGSFVRGFGGKVLIASPELAVLQLALKLPLPKLAELVSELCSTYYYVPAETPQSHNGEEGLRVQARNRERALSRRPVPVSCLQAMTGYAERMTSSRAGRAMVQAVRYAVDGSASPMETALALMLSLPKRMGGYGLPKPQMNVVLSIDGERVRVADLFWPEGNLAVEYDSDAFHAEKDKLHRDARRRNQLESRTVTVLTTTAEHLSSLALLDELAGQIALALGKSLHRNRLASVAKRAMLLYSLKMRSTNEL